jgi:hypothetical protein
MTKWRKVAPGNVSLQMGHPGRRCCNMQDNG